MTAGLLLHFPNQEPLFGAAHGHMFTIDSHVSPYLLESQGTVVKRAHRWFTWSCSCGLASPGDTCWSDPRTAGLLAERHAQRVAIAE